LSDTQSTVEAQSRSVRTAEREQPILECDGQGLKRLVQAGLAWLGYHQETINALNVYPVPDGDTGTNMLLTLQSAFHEIVDSPETHVGQVAQAVAHGALMGARGNSGVILSQLFRGMARSLDDFPAFNAVQFAAAFKEASATAYRGVIKPVEGTILTVAREASEICVAAAAESADLRYVLELVVHQARESVARTPTLLKVLADAGVVDAGGQGLYVILEGMLRYVRGETLAMDAAMTGVVDLHTLEPGEAGYGYDIQFVIHGEDLEIEEIRAHIASLGECPLVVGDATTAKVHVHSPDPGVPLSYGASLGSLSRVIVENMQEQYQDFILSKGQPAQADGPAGGPSTELIGGIGTVVVAPGLGLMRVFESLGASVVVSGGQTMNPSTEDILSAIERVPADQVIVLPNNKNIVMAAQQAQALSTKQVEVVRTVTVPQGIGALLALNYQADLETNARLMADGLEVIQTGEVTRAVRAVEINGLSVEEGEIIGLLNGTLTTKGTQVDEVVFALLEQMSADEYEIVTVYFGESIPPEGAQALAERIGVRYPEQEVELVDGGQPHYSYIVSAE
jgi:hypothetical protein